MATWQSKPITVDGIQVQVHQDVDGITLGKVVDGVWVYSSDILFTPAQADAMADDLHKAARRAREG